MSDVKLKHVGSRPKYPVEHVDGKPGYYTEKLPDGSIKYWNKKTMYSGCGNVLLAKQLVRDDLIFCPYCGDMCNKNQFEETQETE